MKTRKLIFFCLLMAACRRSGQESGTPLAKSVEPAATAPEAAEKKRPVFPYSIVEGGAFTPAELKRAKENDPVVAGHYRNINPDALKPLRLTRGSSGYVSYRAGKQVYWTSNKVNLRKGELVLTDGEHWVRGRCGNQISETPQFPVMTPVRMEPAPAAMETPTTLMTMTQYPRESLELLETAPERASPPQGIASVTDKPNVPVNQIPPDGNGDWFGPMSMPPGTLVPMVAGSGGGAGSGTGGGVPTTGSGIGYPASPFLPPSQVFDVLPALPPFASIIMPLPTQGILPPQAAPTPGSPPVLISYFTTPQPLQLPPLSQSYSQPPYYSVTPPSYVTPHTIITPPGPTPPGNPPPEFKPPDSPSKPQTPPDEPPGILTPEPASVLVTGISLLILAGYYLLARLRFR